MATRLKSLELHGYKTFASRTLFEFPEQITAIVGPNGSGKSNIADAIRWVLGEQSYSLLRGRKTEDMIFAGSEQRPRAGMASAAIIFDNGDGWLPIDYSEVSLARRAYRDGTNEYLLNGQRVRLKETSELLAQSGLAERTYTIIGQGLVDAALSLKPEERRRFFEEAAGIGLYRSRREDAINRLDATRRNLERVQDILAELEPRLATLERQARRAAEYERIKADLRLLLRDWYGYYWHRNNSELLHAKENLRVQDERLEQARSRMEIALAEVEKLRKKILIVRADLSDWHAQASGLHTEWEQISKKTAVLEERQITISNSQVGLDSDLNHLIEEEENRHTQLAILEQEVTRLELELAEASGQVEKARENLGMRQKERERLEAFLRESRRTLVSLETSQVQSRAHLAEVSNRVENLRKTLQNYQSGIKRDSTAVTEAESRLEKARIFQTQAIEEAEAMDEELTVQRRQLAVLENERRALQDERSQLEGESTRTKAQLEVLEQAEKNLSGLGQGARNVVQAARQGKLKGTILSLTSQMVVSHEYETAIAAALAEFVDGVILEEDLLKNTLEYLDSGDQGRAHLIPLRTHQPGMINISDMGENIIGVVCDLVKVPDNLVGVLKILLGNIILVQDRDKAIEILPRLQSGMSAVTLKGEVFRANGIVSAGKENRSSIVARPRQIQEFQNALIESSKAKNENEDRLEKVENTLESCREKTDRLEKEIRQTQSRRNQLAQEVTQANISLEKARHQLQWLQSQVREIENQVHSGEKDIAETKNRLENLDNDIKEANETVRTQIHVLAGLPLEELQTQLTHWTTGAAVSGRALMETRARLNDVQQALKTGQNQQQVLQERIRANRSALEQAEEEKRSLFDKQVILKEQIEGLRLKTEPAETELANLEQEYSRMQGNLTAAQQALSVAERYSSQAQVDFTRQRESLDSLRRRIEEDFGLVAFEYSDQVEGQSTLPLEGMVEQLPRIIELPAELEENINRQRTHLRRMGPISPEALSEYREVKDRRDFMVSQVEDLKKADSDLRQVISELDDLMKREFRKTFTAVAAEFRQMFTRLFNGGSATLELVDEDNLAEAGIEIEARLPGRREQGLSLLSGGERSLTAAALIFSLLKVSPTPFCVLDEVDAMLDEANVGRYRDLLKELSAKTQFIVITHNRNTVQAADVIYGVTMGRDSASQVISLRLDEIGEEMVR